VRPALFGRYRRAFYALLLIASVGFCVQPALTASAAAEPRVAPQAEVGHEGGTETAEGGWGKTLAKTVNFAALAGLLAYFLKTPFVDYLRTRGDTIRRGLTDAAALKSSAEANLVEVRGRLSALPAELDALRRRGLDELADERVRLAEATAREKQRIIDRTHREIDLQVRIARRRLLEYSAETAMRLARARIERDITPDDQTRLIDTYASEVRA
jgi:F0F1-type ATP synthase membrane subunit b/b'